MAIKFQTISPFNNKIIAAYDIQSDTEVSQQIEECYTTHLKWRNVSMAKKISLLKDIAYHLRDEQQIYAKLITNEMGKPIVEAISEIKKCVLVCKYYAENGSNLLRSKIVDLGTKQAEIHFESIGVLLAIMPWNFPFWQVFRVLAPAIISGNVIVLKHAENVCGCGKAITDIFNKIKAPYNLCRQIIISTKQIESVISNSKIAAVTLTGSINAGSVVAEISGKYIKKTVLELGGSDAYIVTANSDLNLAAKLCVKSRMINCGQSCIGAKRIIVHKDIYQQLLHRLIAEIKQYIIGNPLDQHTRMGPMVSIRQREILHEQVSKSIAQGAKCLIGGRIISGIGAYYPATILTNVKKNMPAYEEELFGPVLSIITYQNEQEAIAIANDSQFGLGGAIFSKNSDKAQAMAMQIHTGNVAINDFVQSDPHLPFGGVKKSGYGRELSSFGINEFINIKTIVKPSHG